MKQNQTQWMRCAVCSEYLDYGSTTTAGFGAPKYTHVSTSHTRGSHRRDHDPQPVPIRPGDHMPMIGQCDWCASFDVEYVFYTAGQTSAEAISTRPTGPDEYRRLNRTGARRTTFAVRHEQEIAGTTEFNRSPGWLACAGCAVLVEANDIEKLITRVKASIATVPRFQGRNPSRSSLRAQWTEFFATRITGGLRRLPDGTTPLMPAVPYSAMELAQIARGGTGADVQAAVQAMDAVHGPFITAIMIRSAAEAVEKNGRRR